MQYGSQQVHVSQPDVRMKQVFVSHERVTLLWQISLLRPAGEGPHPGAFHVLIDSNADAGRIT